MIRGNGIRVDGQRVGTAQEVHTYGTAGCESTPNLVDQLAGGGRRVGGRGLVLRGRVVGHITRV